MAWPPTPLPINFQNATVSVDTHPQAHNATNLQLNNDIVPEVDRLRNGITAPDQFLPTMRVANVAVTLETLATRWTRNNSVVTAYAYFEIFAFNGPSTGEATFGFQGLPPMQGTTALPVGSFNWSAIGNPAVAPIGQAVWASPTVFAALMTNGAYLNGLFQSGDRFRWQISYMI